MAPRTKVLNLYGPSEATLASFYRQIPHQPDPGLQPEGSPLPHTELVRVKLDNGGDHGEFRIAIRSPRLSLGYLTGTASPVDEARFHRSGDLNCRFVTEDRGQVDAAGRLYVLGRLDSIVKRRGVTVDLARIEQVATHELGVTATCCL